MNQIVLTYYYKFLDGNILLVTAGSDVKTFTLCCNLLKSLPKMWRKCF